MTTEEKIKDAKWVRGSIVLHELSGLYYICENNKQAMWMNINPYYKLMPPDIVPKSYFQKAIQ